MSGTFKEVEKTPTLVFGEMPDMKEKAELNIIPEKKEEEMDDAMLTPEEREMVKNFSEQIDIKNTNAILSYGAGVQKKMADFSEAALENVRSKDLGEIGAMLSNVVTELKCFDEEEESKGLFGGLFKKAGNKVTSMKTKYAKVEENVTEICKSLESHQVTLLKDIALLDKMYELNLSYFKEVTIGVQNSEERFR